jgi:hypothetical protein
MAVELSQADREQLVSVLQQVWNNIAEDWLSGFSEQELRDLNAFDMVAAATDYVGLHYGSAEDARLLRELSDEELVKIGLEAGISRY